MARPGNRILVTKTAALEAPSILANTFPGILERHTDSATTRKAQALFESMSTVEDALTAASVGLRDGGGWAMHDATEYGGPGGASARITKRRGPGLARGRPLVPPERDDFWPAFGRAMAGATA